MNNQMREKFEAWAKDQPATYQLKPNKYRSYSDTNRYYDSERTEYTYQGFCGALASQTCVAEPELPPDAFKEAYMEWSRKTDWVQEQISTFPITALGMHRADVMREEIERLRADLSASEAKNAKTKTPMPITDAAYNNLRSVGRMICNMLRRDETPVRAEAAEDLQHAIARLDPEMGETIIAPQPSKVRGQSFQITPDRLQNWIDLAHDNERSMGDRLQSLSSVFGLMLHGESAEKYPLAVIREQLSPESKLTRMQAVILTGFTGVMCVNDFRDFHADVNNRMKRPVWIHEFPALREEIKELYRADFLAMLPASQPKPE